MTVAACREEALAFDCEGERLIGVVSLPAAPSETALIVVVGGPQVRTGSHRQFSQLCRTVAAAGVAAFRYDVRGMGDSSGALRTFEDVEADICAAIDALQGRLPHVRRVVLWGLCDGASAALMYCEARRDVRVGGLVLLNPWVRSEQTLARAHVKHYYLDRLRQPAFWRKLWTGGVALRSVTDLASKVRIAMRPGRNAISVTAAARLPFQQRMLVAAERFSGPILFVLSELDYTAREFSELLAQERRWQAVCGRVGVQRLDVAGADHTFSSLDSQTTLQTVTVGWLYSSVDEPGHVRAGSAVSGRQEIE